MPEFRFSWRLAADGHIQAAGRASDGVKGIVLYGNGLGAGPYSAGGAVIANVRLERNVLYVFSFLPPQDFAPFLKTRPAILIEPAEQL
jgi:hypothetical protein